MKKQVVGLMIFILILTGINSLSAQQSWIWQNPLPNGHSIKANYFFDANTGFVAGEYGNIMKTTNGGVNWTVYTTGSTDEISGIVFVNSLTGYASGGYDLILPAAKKIYKTTNGGANWVSTILGSTYPLSGVDFVNSNLGIAISTYQTIHYTTNGGTNWTDFTGTAVVNYCIDYVTPALAFIGGTSGTIQRTTNGGANWSSSVVAGSNSIRGLAFADSLTGYAVGSGNTVLKTTNAGTNWFSVAPTNFSYSHNSVSFLNSNTGMIAGESGKILTTTNGGTNWALSMTFFYDLPTYNSCRIAAANIYYAFGDKSSRTKTTNGGSTWENLLPVRNTGIFSSFFLDANTGWVSENGSIRKTTNGGTNWVSTELGLSNNITGLNFINASTGFAIAAFNTNGEYLKTTNGGVNWELTVAVPGKSFTNIFFANSTTGYISGSYEIYKTTNTGTSWTLSDSSGYSPYNLVFVNANTGYVTNFVASSTVFKKTTNGGVNWIQAGAPITSANIAAMRLFGSDTIYAFGSNNFYKSYNGGVNWTNAVYTGTTVQACGFLNQSTGYIGGVFGVLKQTTDEGLSWTNVNSGTANAINAMYINGMQMWIMGEGSSILKSTIVITSERGIVTEIPDKFLLLQNYPNPFNPETNIKFNLPENSYVSLRVYDILGKEVSTVVSGNLNSGSYSYVFNAGSLPSGIYFYKIAAGKYSDVKKMVLLK